MRVRQVLLVSTILIALVCAALSAWPRGLFAEVHAQQVDQPPPPPTKTPIEPPTNTPSVPTDTPQPPTQTFTPQPPTQTFTPQPPTPTNTPAPPTDTPKPKPTASPQPSATPQPTKQTVMPKPTASPQPSATPQPTQQPPAQPSEEPQPDPSCQSSVAGLVTNAAGQPVAGASVSIQGQGWSKGILTDDKGRYGFGGLCAGDATLQATLPGGQTWPSVTVALDGENNLQLDLGSQATAATASPSPTITATRQTGPETPAAEPGMPATGFPGWLLVGGALLAALLLLGGVRWFLCAQRRAHER